MRRLSVLIVLALGLVALSGASASAAETQVFQSSFDGTGSSKGPFSAGRIGEIAIDRQSGSVYVTDQGKEVVDKFDALGKPSAFSSLGVNTIPQQGASAVAVDNSSSPTQGDLYTGGMFVSEVGKYNSDGSPAGGAFPINVEAACSLAVSPVSAHLWAATIQGDIREFDSSGAATGASFGGTFCKVALDAADNIYLGYFGTPTKLDASNGYARVEPSPFLGLPPSSSLGPAFAINPVNQDVYLVQDNLIYVYHSSNEPTEPVNVLTGFVSVAGLAFDGEGNLYVAEGGTVADPTSTKVYRFKRQPASAPVIKSETAIGVHSISAELGGQIAAAGSATSYHVEYGPDASYGTSLPTVALGSNATPYAARTTAEGLTPGTTYHYRVVATNADGTTYGPDRTFSTFTIPPGGNDPCPNALARKQTGARALPGCRAYELVSAADTGGYDVESSLVPGQTPFPGYPQAADRVLYATHAGAVPGPWNATNKGPDPYLATRGANGWSTNYVGLPANLNPASGAFSSILGEADSGLDSLAFAGAGLCAPCFSFGLETGIPLRLENGELTQGMSGSLAATVPPSARPEGEVAKYFSADGRHLVFASKYAFEPGANSGGDLTVYDRNLSTGTTQIASTSPAGTALTGAGISELDISADGLRIVTARRVSTDPAGNEYVHPYLHLGTAPNGVDLAPGTTAGVLYAGMSADGSRVFFTTTDKLLGADGDESADLYEADVDAAGDLALHLVTTASSDACNPVANEDGPHWNTTGSAASCGAVAIAGGGGVASASGAIYFLSPEQLDGAEGTLNQPNLYLARPGQSPVFVATLEPGNPLVRDSVKAAATRRTADFQVTPSGAYAVFAALQPPPSGEGEDGVQVLRYDAAADQVGCASCDPTRSDVRGTPSLPPGGSGLTDDGRVFFDSPLALALNDTDNRGDVYEWAGARPQLISSGTSPFDSSLLSVSAGGADVFFFTHDTLAPEEDRNGQLVKIYDARAGGGFFKLPQNVPCAASDECHGRGTVAPAAPDIKSSGQTSNGNVLVCKKNRVKRRGKCVAKKRHQAKKHRHTNKRRGNRHA